MSEQEGTLENLEILMTIEGKILLDDLDKTLRNCARGTADSSRKIIGQKLACQNASCSNLILELINEAFSPPFSFLFLFVKFNGILII